jgi:predicted nucleotidyltransferase
MMTAIQYLPEVISRINRRFNPLKIVLFGSHARGAADPGSDLDVLVVFRSPLASKRTTTVQILSAVSDLPVAVDCIVTTDSELEMQKQKKYSIVAIALNEGKVVSESD